MDPQPMIDLDLLADKINQTRELLLVSEKNKTYVGDLPNGDDLLDWWDTEYPCLLWGENNLWEYEDEENKIFLRLSKNKGHWSGQWVVKDLASVKELSGPVDAQGQISSDAKPRSFEIGAWHSRNYDLDSIDRLFIYRDYYGSRDAQNKLNTLVDDFRRNVYTNQMRAWCIVGYQISTNIGQVEENPRLYRPTHQLLNLLEGLRFLSVERNHFDILASLLDKRYNIGEHDGNDLINAVISSAL